MKWLFWLWFCGIYTIFEMGWDISNMITEYFNYEEWKDYNKNTMFILKGCAHMMYSAILVSISLIIQIIIENIIKWKEKK